MRPDALDWGVIASFMLVSLLVGLYLTRRASRSLSEFFLSGRNLPWWLAGTSMVATTFSSDTPLYVTGLVRGHGIYENWQWWCFILAGMLQVFLFARLWRRAGVLTDVELIGMRYSGRSASVLRAFKAVYFSTVIHTIIKAQVILAMAKIMEVSVGWGKWESIVISSAVTIAYSAMSGYWGVVTTDLLQFAIAMVGAVALAVLSLGKIGGVGVLRTHLTSETLSFFPPVTSGEFVGTALMAFLGYVGLSWWSKYSSDGGGVIVQRISSCRSEREGLIATFWFNIANYALRTWPWVLAALASLVLYPAAADNEAVYPRMVMDILPSGLRGLMLASFFAAFMSTLSTYLNLSSAYFVNDFYRPFVKKDAGDPHYIMVARLMTVVLSALTALVTFYVTSIVGVFKFLIAFGSGTGLVYIVRWFWWRVNAWSEISAMVASTAMTVVAYTVFEGVPYYGKLALIISVSTAVWLLATFLTKPVEEGKLLEFLEVANPGGRGWRPVRRLLPAGRDGESLGPPLLRWAYGSLLVIGLTLGAGKAVLGFAVPALAWLGLGLVAAWLLVQDPGTS
ncbi:MAG: Na+:solute symporter [Nitrospirota bacterium]